MFDQVLLEYELSDNEFLDGNLVVFITEHFREERYRCRVMEFIQKEINAAEPESYQQRYAQLRMAGYLIPESVKLKL